MGSKRRIAKDILPIILKDRKEGQWFVDMFCGGCNLIDKVDGKRIANEYNEYIYEMWDSLVNKKWIPPNEITEDTFNLIKNNKDKYPKELVGFTGIAVTFGSKWFNTYARNSRGTNYAIEGRGNLLEQVESLKGVRFFNRSYIDFAFKKRCIIYCDPPYAGTSGYKDKFNHIEFWQWCREKTVEGHSVFISEYNAPDDFECIWSKDLPSNMNAKAKTKPTEKLFTYKANQTIFK